jgi:hypothetical protein
VLQFLIILAAEVPLTNREIFTLVKEIAEFISFLVSCISGPILIYFAWRGLQQITVAKHATKISSQRDAFKIAAEQTGLFAEKIEFPFISLRDEVAFEAIVLGENVFISVSEDKIDSAQSVGVDIDKLNKVRSLATFQTLVHKLDNYALYFTSGVAQEEVGFIATGKRYCEYVHALLPFIIDPIKEGYYPNLQTLFVNWYKRIEAEKLALERSQIDEKISRNQPKRFNTIGE